MVMNAETFELKLSTSSTLLSDRIYGFLFRLYLVTLPFVNNVVNSDTRALYDSVKMVLESPVSLTPQ